MARQVRSKSLPLQVVRYTYFCAPKGKHLVHLDPDVLQKKKMTTASPNKRATGAAGTSAALQRLERRQK